MERSVDYLGYFILYTKCGCLCVPIENYYYIIIYVTVHLLRHIEM